MKSEIVEQINQDNPRAYIAEDIVLLADPENYDLATIIHVPDNSVYQIGQTIEIESNGFYNLKPFKGVIKLTI